MYGPHHPKTHLESRPPPFKGAAFIYNGCKGQIEKQKKDRKSNEIVEISIHLTNAKGYRKQWKKDFIVMMILDCKRSTIEWAKSRDLECLEKLRIINRTRKNRKGGGQPFSIGTIAFGPVKIPKGETWYPFMRCTRMITEKFQILE